MSGAPPQRHVNLSCHESYERVRYKMSIQMRMRLGFQNDQDFLRALQQCQDLAFGVLDHTEFVIQFFNRWQFDLIELWCIDRNMAFHVVV